MCGGENIPCRRAHGAPAECTLPAESGACRIVLRKQIARGKDIRALGIRGGFAVSGELDEEIIIVCSALGTVEEIVKQLVCVFVVAPEYGEIVLHLSLSCCSPVGYRAFSASSNTRKKPWISAASIAPRAQRRNVDAVCILPG